MSILLQSGLAAEIANSIRKQILNNTLVGGDKLKQDHLASAFNASHVPIREALQLLVAQGLAEHVPRRGVIVKKMSVDDILEVVEMRATLEGLALQLSCDHLTPQHFSQAEALLKQERHEKNLDQLLALNWQFHRILYSGVERPRLQHTIEDLWLHSERYMRFVWEHAAYHGKSHTEHEALLALCKADNQRAALKQLRAHIKDAGHAVKKMMAQLSVDL